MKNEHFPTVEGGIGDPEKSNRADSGPGGGIAAGGPANLSLGRLDEMARMFVRAVF